MLVNYEHNDKYLLQLEEGEGEDGESYVFLHLQVTLWNKSVFKELKLLLEEVINLAAANGYSKLNFYVEKDVGTKFHNMLKPLDYEQEFNNGRHIAGGWFTGV